MRIIVKNLPKNIKKETISKHFSKIKNLNKEINLELTEVSFPTDLNRRFCFIGFKNEIDATQARSYFDGTYLKNYKIIVEPCKKDDYQIKRSRLDTLIKKKTVQYKTDDFIDSNEIEMLNFPNCTSKNDIQTTFGKYLTDFYLGKRCVLYFKDIESSGKAQKENDIFLGCKVTYKKYTNERIKCYNNLFFDFKTIIEKISREEKINKQDLVDLKNKNLGANIAILESDLVQKTREWLTKNNINLDNPIPDQDKKILLIRNFDVINKLEGLEKADVKICPSGIIGIAIFKNEKDAEIAYKKFAYKRINDKAVYCDYAPANMLNSKNKETENKLKTNKVIIKNIPFQANVEEIQKIIESKTKIKKIRMPIKRNKDLRGFCFVEFEDHETALFVCNYFGESTHLYGRRLIFNLADQ